jgi:hypothetical protein
LEKKKKQKQGGEGRGGEGSGGPLEAPHGNAFARVSVNRKVSRQHMLLISSCIGSQIFLRISECVPVWGYFFLKIREIGFMRIFSKIKMF